jgi:glycosyltransferase involved in cell wall biosynthesis
MKEPKSVDAELLLREPAVASRVAALVPCKNEGLTIAHVVAAFRRELPEAEIWVCDNRSTDNTAAVARKAGARVVREERPGKGYAVRRLFAVVDADLYALVDGDGTYDAKAVRAIVRFPRQRSLGHDRWTARDTRS